jgi:hypothetical protein
MTPLSPSEVSPISLGTPQDWSASPSGGGFSTAGQAGESTSAPTPGVGLGAALRVG